jgi:hypothetical protein
MLISTGQISAELVVFQAPQRRLLNLSPSSLRSKAGQHSHLHTLNPCGSIASLLPPTGCKHFISCKVIRKSIVNQAFIKSTSPTNCCAPRLFDGCPADSLLSYRERASSQLLSVYQLLQSSRVISCDLPRISRGEHCLQTYVTRRVSH